MRISRKCSCSAAFAIVALLSATTDAATFVIDVKSMFQITDYSDMKGGFSAAIVILTILAAILTGTLVALNMSNEKYFATKADESDDENDDGDDVEMRNVMEGGGEDEEGEEEEGEGEEESK